MQVDYDVITEILVYSLCFFSIYLIFYKKYIYSVADPLFIYIITLSFSSVLVCTTLNNRPLYLLHFFVCQGFLYCGFRFTSGWLSKKPVETYILHRITGYIHLRQVVIILFVIYLIANIVLFYTTGFALLSDDPTTAKVENFSKGFGIILKINWGIGGFLIAGVIFLLLTKPTVLTWIMLIIIICLTALEGSKSSLLRIVITFFMLINHRLFANRTDILNKVKYIVPISFIAVTSVFFIVLYKEATEPQQIILSFIKRLLYGADSTLYYYTPINEQYFAMFTYWEYPEYILNQILSFMRLVSPKEALGNVMVANVLPDNNGTIVGPNTPYYIEGQIYFGYYGAFAYSAVVGSLYAFIREYFFRTRYYTTFWLVLMCCICQQAIALTVEVTLFLTQAFDTCFFVLPVYVGLGILLEGRIKLRKFHF